MSALQDLSDPAKASQQALTRGCTDVVHTGIWEYLSQDETRLSLAWTADEGIPQLLNGMMERAFSAT